MRTENYEFQPCERVGGLAQRSPPFLGAGNAFGKPAYELSDQFAEAQSIAHTGKVILARLSTHEYLDARVDTDVRDAECAPPEPDRN